MSTISVAELKEKSAQDLLNCAGKENLVITAGGHPVAVLVDLHGISTGSAEALMRSVTALKAQASLQSAATQTGIAKLSMDEIDAEIAAVRRGKRK
jgi:hypothetical protein